MHEVRWRAVEHDDLDGPCESRREIGLGVERHAQEGARRFRVENAEIDIAARGRRPAGDAAEQINGDDLRTVGEGVRHRDFELGETHHATRVYLLLGAHTLRSALIEGDTGTGKTTAALSLHEASPRAQGPLVTREAEPVSAGALRRDVYFHLCGVRVVLPSLSERL